MTKTILNVFLKHSVYCRNIQHAWITSICLS